MVFEVFKAALVAKKKIGTFLQSIEQATLKSTGEEGVEKVRVDLSRGLPSIPSRPKRSSSSIGCSLCYNHSEIW